ncbi:MAG: ABC transporter ATP-binding protein [Planctomycetota bacterium]
MTAVQTDEPPISESDAAAVCVRGLSHTYKPIRQRGSRRHAPPTQDAALDQIDLEVSPGEVFALLGPNGSGKSTLLRILATLQAPRGNKGSATIFGTDVARSAHTVRGHLGVVFQNPALDLKLSAYENLSVHGRLYGLSGKPLDGAIKQALERLGLADRIDDHVDSFSGGMRRRVEIAKALLTEPRLLLMDEASAGLDLAIQREIWKDLRQLVADTGLTVLLTTHLMDEAELADRVAVMANGKVVSVDTPGALMAQVGGQVLEIAPGSGVPADQLCKDVAVALRERHGGIEPIVAEGRVRLEHDEAPAMIALLSDALGDRSSAFRLGRPTLADAYLKLTGESLQA